MYSKQYLESLTLQKYNIITEAQQLKCTVLSKRIITHEKAIGSPV